MRTRLQVPFYKCAALPREIAIFMLFSKSVSTTQHKIKRLASTKRSFLQMHEKSLKIRPQQTPSKNLVKRMFVQSDKKKETFSFQKVLFFISQNGRPDEKKKTEKGETAARL